MTTSSGLNVHVYKCETAAVRADFGFKNTKTDTELTKFRVTPPLASDCAFSVVSVRGTSSFKDVLSDLNFLMTANPFGAGKLHRGILRAYLSMRDYALDHARHLARAIDDPPNEDDITEFPFYNRLRQQRAARRPVFLVSGHSLGAALATLLAYDVLKQGIFTHWDLRLVGIGSPRVGDEAFKSDFASLLPPTHCALYAARARKGTHGRRTISDLITVMPPRALGFRHAAPVRPLYPPGGAAMTRTKLHLVSSYLAALEASGIGTRYCQTAKLLPEDKVVRVDMCFTSKIADGRRTVIPARSGGKCTKKQEKKFSRFFNKTCRENGQCVDDAQAPCSAKNPWHFCECRAKECGCFEDVSHGRTRDEQKFVICKDAV